MLDGHGPPVALVTDVEVLAEHAAQITAREEYRARASGADEDAFLAEMGANGADHRHFANSAKACFSLAAMDPAQMRTERAGIHAIPQLLNGIAGFIHSYCFVRSVLPVFRALI